jgi:DNA-binding transcriptional regulator YhcF (GntR family)
MTTDATYYAAMADKLERDPINGPGVNGRATVPLGQGFERWRRFKLDQDVLWIDDADGVSRWITRLQADLISHLQSLPDGTHVIMRELAVEFDCAASTISRAMTKFASFGVLTYSVGRGRYGGAIVYQFLREVAPDLAKRFRELAKTRVRAWAKAAEARVSRLKMNIASNFTWKEIEAHHMESHYSVVMDASLKRPWTVEELREAGIV